MGAPPASAHTSAERAATMTWLATTNQMWTKDDFAALDRVTTGEGRLIYRTEQDQAAGDPSPSGRAPFRLTGLSITVPCRSGAVTGGAGAVFVAYADTDVFTLGQSLRPEAMVFRQAGGTWKLAAVVNGSPAASGPRWPALCRAGAGPGRGRRAGARGTTGRPWPGCWTTPRPARPRPPAAAAPFAVNSFFAGPDSINVQFATDSRHDRAAGVILAQRFAPLAEAGVCPAPGWPARLLAGGGVLPDQHLPLGRRHPEGQLAGRQFHRVIPAGRGAPGDRHLRHHLHGRRSAALGRRPGHAGRLLRLAADGFGALTKPGRVRQAPVMCWWRGAARGPLLRAQRARGRGPGGHRRGDRGQQVPGQEDRRAAGGQQDAGTTVTGATPSDPAKPPHAQRPAATPRGTPTTRAISSVSVVCQPTMARSWRRVMPRVFSRASSRRRLRTEVSTVSARDSIAAAARPRARASGWPPIWVALTMAAARARCSPSW